MTIVFAFRPSTEDYVNYETNALTDGFLYTIYDTEKENPYAVPEPDIKIRRAGSLVSPQWYSLYEDERWIKLDYQSVIDGSPERIEESLHKL